MLLHAVSLALSYLCPRVTGWKMLFPVFGMEYQSQLPSVQRRKVAMSIYSYSTYSHTPEEYFVVRLPFKDKMTQTNSENTAKSCFRRLEGILSKNAVLADAQVENFFYSPLHAVFQNDDKKKNTSLQCVSKNCPRRFSKFFFACRSKVSGRRFGSGDQILKVAFTYNVVKMFRKFR